MLGNVELYLFIGTEVGMANIFATTRHLQEKVAKIVSRSTKCTNTIGLMAQATLNLRYPKQITSIFLQKTQWWSENHLKELQLEGLKQLIIWARSKCPYYRNFPSVHCLEDLEKYPILTKRIIHDHFNDLVAKDMRLLVGKVSTGGTCSPVTIMRDICFEPARQAGYQRFCSWINSNPRANPRICYIWTSRDLGRRPSYTPHALYLPVERLRSRNDANKYLREIKRFRPDNITGYVHPLVTLAQYELMEHINPQIGAITCNCETLSPEHRKLLEKAFRCHVFNFFGSQDLGSMAQDCKKHEGLHLNAERYILEVTRDGRFLFTDLLSYGMPIIRYENQDMGKLLERRCSCGRGLPLIEEVIGRVLSFVLTKKGTWVTIASLRDEMYRVKGFRELIEKFQLLQEEVGKVTLLLKPWEKEKVPDLKALARIWSKNELDVEPKIVDSIILSKSGKQLPLVSKFTPPWIGKC